MQRVNSTPPLPSLLLPSVFFCSFSFQLAWFAAEKLGKQTENRPGPCGCRCREDAAGSPAPPRPGEGCTLGDLPSPPSACGSALCCRSVFHVFWEQLSRGCGEPVCEFRGETHRRCGLWMLWLAGVASRWHRTPVCTPGVCRKGLHLLLNRGHLPVPALPAFPSPHCDRCSFPVAGERFYTRAGRG